MTMVIPCLQEQDIKRLDTIPRERMRPEFLDQINVIRLKVYQQCGAKKLNGSYLNSRMYVKLAEEYVKAINQGSVPMIQNAWQGVLENECMGALENARKTYDTAFNEYFREQDRVYRKNDISSILKSLRDKAFTIFSVINSVKEGDEELFNTYMDELINHIERREKAVSERNAANCEA